MQKLQELITKHKEKLRDWTFDKLEIDNTAYNNQKIIDEETIIIDWRINREPMCVFSLSDLLFSTPFLSLLSWDDSKCDATRTKQHIKNWTFIEWYSIYESYHKINLALLESDKERVDYISNFTL